MPNWAIDEKTQEHYRSAMEQCAVDPLFQIFRRVRVVRNVIETKGREIGDCWEMAIKTCPRLAGLADRVLRADRIGDPETHWLIPFQGWISSTMAHYALSAAVIDRVTGGLDGCSLAEIGSGYGGLLSILGLLYPQARLYAVDIPETRALRERFCWEAGARNVMTAASPPQRCDCVVSFAALSELDAAGRDRYGEQLLAGSRWGVLGWNWPEPPRPERLPNVAAGLDWTRRYAPGAVVLADTTLAGVFGDWDATTIVWGL